MKTDPKKIYKKGMGIHEVLEQLQQQQVLTEKEIESSIVYPSTGLYIHLRPRAKIDLLPELRSGETGKRNRLLDE